MKYASAEYARMVEARDARDAELARLYPWYIIVGQAAGRRGAEVRWGRSYTERTSYLPPLSNVTYSPE